MDEEQQALRNEVRNGNRKRKKAGKKEERGCLSDLFFVFPEIVFAPIQLLFRGILAFFRNVW